ncbi:hypothetical protein IQ254_03965 [Nodosilinea sp. LEGE 07088]|uniref:hypothetical protein n=1 Tax=Nodosilinea sp. LEGE 07088 TaxID=2777968 RepID=UPI0018828A37|nr:hypothetical protein [Nodosilinea sp. LEGE 07088]MBE9136364.1 hypothetical protein [Nodosilinea sp. LEGE 07088]
MPAKRDIQTILKKEYGINKNITQGLSLEDCENLLILLGQNSTIGKFVEVVVEKNGELSQNNRYYGLKRSQAEKKFEQLQVENQKLEKSILDLEASNQALVNRRGNLSKEQRELQAQVDQLNIQNRDLSLKMQQLTTQNDELSEANNQLKRDNKELKNIVDQIRLRLARDTKMLLQYEDSELRKAIIRLFRWTLG